MIIRYLSICFFGICLFSSNMLLAHDAGTPISSNLQRQQNFLHRNGYLRGEYIFSDNENRRLTAYFVNKDTLIIINESIEIPQDKMAFDTYRVHFTDLRTIVVDSVIMSVRNDTTWLGNLYHEHLHPIKCKGKPATQGSEAKKVNCAHEVFPLLQPKDEIFVSKNLRKLRIKGFLFLLKDELIEDYFKLYQNWRSASH